MMKKWLWPAALFLFANGFFVARVPDATRPELAPISSIFVLILAFPVFWALKNWLGIRRAALVMLVLGVYAVAFESLALKTGLPYGHFSYGEKLGWKIGGLVPWTVFFAWSPIMPAVVAVSSRFSQKLWPRLVWSAVLATLVDGVLDPGAVSQGFWAFQNPGVYYGVPFSNFLGWLVSGFCGAALVAFLVPPDKRETVWPLELGASLVLILAFWTSVCLFSGLWIPAILGFFWLGFFSTQRQEAHEAAQRVCRLNL